jgi:hypothetical protein
MYTLIINNFDTTRYSWVNVQATKKHVYFTKHKQFIPRLIKDRNIKLSNRNHSTIIREDLGHRFIPTVSSIDKVCDSKLFTCIEKKKQKIIKNPIRAYSESDYDTRFFTPLY